MTVMCSCLEVRESIVISSHRTRVWRAIAARTLRLGWVRREGEGGGEGREGGGRKEREGGRGGKEEREGGERERLEKGKEEWKEEK